MAGGDDKLAGKGKEALGSLTGDESKKQEGKGQNMAGKAQGAAADAANKAGETLTAAKDAVTGNK